MVYICIHNHDTYTHSGNETRTPGIYMLVFEKSAEKKVRPATTVQPAMEKEEQS